MKGVLILGVFSAAVIAVVASSIHKLPIPADDLEMDSSDNVETQILENLHGNRMKRSPLDPIVAPLLIGKSFLYGALIGPKLFHRPKYYYHPKPSYHHYGGHGYGWGWGWGK